MNDINPTTGLPMSSGGIDVGGTPYGSSSDSFVDGASESSGSDFNNIVNYWSWKVDVVIMLIVIGGDKCLFLDRLNILTFLNIFSKIN